MTNTFNDEEVVFDIRRYMLIHLQNLNHCLADIKKTRSIIASAKSQFCMSKIKIVEYICDAQERHFDTIKIVKILKWSTCQNLLTAWAFLEVCVYYRIWISNFSIMIKSIYQLFQKKAFFEWSVAQMKVMNELKLTLTTTSTLKALDYNLTAEEIILAIDASLREWKAVLMQIFQKKRHLCRYESELWNEVERNYDVEKKNVKICWKH